MDFLKRSESRLTINWLSEEFELSTEEVSLLSFGVITYYKEYSIENRLAFQVSSDKDSKVLF
jgi:hypothetical protein